jgi:hypothetical protein
MFQKKNKTREDNQISPNNDPSEPERSIIKHMDFEALIELNAETLIEINAARLHCALLRLSYLFSCIPH